LLGILIPPPTTYLSSPQKNPKTSKTEFSLDDKPRRKREITIFAIDLILCPLIFGILSPSFFKTMTLHIRLGPSMVLCFLRGFWFIPFI